MGLTDYLPDVPNPFNYVPEIPNPMDILPSIPNPVDLLPSIPNPMDLLPSIPNPLAPYEHKAEQIQQNITQGEVNTAPDPALATKDQTEKQKYQAQAFAALGVDEHEFAERAHQRAVRAHVQVRSRDPEVGRHGGDGLGQGRHRHDADVHARERRRDPGRRYGQGRHGRARR
jgi:hypothetical protein